MKKLFVCLLSVSISLLVADFSKGNEVRVSGRKILLNGSPYIIKGICYNPVPKGSSSRNWGTLTEDLSLMTEAGINTIRVYSPIDEEAVLDEIAASGITVIISFGYNMDGYYDMLSGTYLDYIQKYKDHDAILLWEFGNEYNYHPEWFDNNIANWYSALDDAAVEARLEDPNHPAATAHGELPDAQARTSCPNIDVWGMNVYRWDNPGDIFGEWEAVSGLPMYLSEAGADRYMKVTQNGYAEGENEQAQADATQNILNSIFSHSDIGLGVALFEFSDEWWKAGDPAAHDVGGWAPNSSGVPYDGAPNEEYWGIVDVDRNKTQAFEIVKTKYNSIVAIHNNQVHSFPIQVFPSPSQNSVNLVMDLPEIVNCSYAITNLGGSLIRAGSITNNSLQITNLKTGFFLLHIYGDNVRITKKIVVH